MKNDLLCLLNIFLVKQNAAGYHPGPIPPSGADVISYVGHFFQWSVSDTLSSAYQRQQVPSSRKISARMNEEIPSKSTKQWNNGSKNANEKSSKDFVTNRLNESFAIGQLKKFFRIKKCCVLITRNFFCNFKMHQATSVLPFRQIGVCYKVMLCH